MKGLNSIPTKQKKHGDNFENLMKMQIIKNYNFKIIKNYICELTNVIPEV